MTSNQIQNRRNQEDARHNRASEKEAKRSNKASERITRSANKETARSNRAREKETHRSNVTKETIQGVTGGLNAISSGVGGVGGLLRGLHAINDPSWYNLDPQLVEDAASISYDTALGMLGPKEFYSSSKYQILTPGQRAVPGLMRIGYIPSIGATNDTAFTKSVNVAARNIYAFVRHANSGSRNYEAADLMMYILQLDSVYTMLSHVRRCYSIALTAKGRNRYYPNAYAYACGFDLEDALENLANYRMQLNALSVSVNSFYVPNSMPLFNRHVWMASNIFKDSEVHKSQEYIFVPEIYYTWNSQAGFLTANLTPKYDTMDTGANTIGTNTPKPKLQEWLNAISEQLNTMLADEDVGTISGDILKAYGEDSLYFVPSTESDFHVESIYSLEVLSQIAGAVPVGSLTGLYSQASSAWTHDLHNTWSICQDPQSQIYVGKPQDNTQPSYVQTPPTLNGPTIGASGYTGSENIAYDPENSLPDGAGWILNMYKDSPTPDDNMVASRLIATYNTISDTNPTHTSYHVTHVLNSFATEVVTEITIYLYQNTEGMGTDLPVNLVWYSMYDGMVVAAFPDGSGVPGARMYGDISLTASQPQDQCLLSQDSFAWSPSPRAWAIDYSASATEAPKWSYAYVIHDGRDFCNYAWLSDQTIANMHAVATLSLFGIPKLGMKVRTR